MLGYCRECDRLVRILPRGFREGFGKQNNWYPVKHPRLGDDTGGEDCPGVLKAL